VEAQGIIVKSGWQAGKGVTVATTVEEAQAAEAIFQGQFAKAGKFVLVEVFDWAEASVLALTDGLTIRPCYRSGSQAGGGGDGRRIPAVWELMLAPLNTGFKGKNEQKFCSREP